MPKVQVASHCLNRRAPCGYWVILEEIRHKAGVYFQDVSFRHETRVANVDAYNLARAASSLQKERHILGVGYTWYYLYTDELSKLIKTVFHPKKTNKLIKTGISQKQKNDDHQIKWYPKTVRSMSIWWQGVECVLICVASQRRRVVGVSGSKFYH
jgi:hypothetical protein